ncbi:hypothetical protein RR11_3260 [Ruegeria sp. R11]|nr:hypothetical protein RR11_3260 [Ruegeria sp. R11]
MSFMANFRAIDGTKTRFRWEQMALKHGPGEICRILRQAGGGGHCQPTCPSSP